MREPVKVAVIPVRVGKKQGPKKHSFVVDLSFSGTIDAETAKEALKAFLEAARVEEFLVGASERRVTKVSVLHAAQAMGARWQRAREAKVQARSIEETRRIARRALEQRKKARRLKAKAQATDAE